jgi:exonuclease VII large subunit
MRTGSSRVLGGVFVAVLVLTAAACGGGAGNPNTSTAAGDTSAEAWADGICSSFTTWKQSLESIRDGVSSQPSASQLRRAGREFQVATQELERSLRQLDAPDTAQGEAAKKNLDQLATTLQSDLSKLEDTLKSPSSGAAGTLSQISTISATLATMASNLKLAGANLKNLAPSGELRQGFHQASACAPYVH